MLARRQSRSAASRCRARLAHSQAVQLQRLTVCAAGDAVAGVLDEVFDAAWWLQGFFPLRSAGSVTLFGVMCHERGEWGGG